MWMCLVDWNASNFFNMEAGSLSDTKTSSLVGCKVFAPQNVTHFSNLVNTHPKPTFGCLDSCVGSNKLWEILFLIHLSIQEFTLIGLWCEQVENMHFVWQMPLRMHATKPALNRT